MTKLKIGCLQLQLMKSGNFELVKEKILSFKQDKCDIIVLSELCVGGPGSKNTEYYLDNYQDKFSVLAKELKELGAQNIKTINIPITKATV